MRQRAFLIGDTHLGHKKMVEYRGFASQKEHDEAVIDRWNSVVHSRDTVWHLGDVLFGNKQFELLSRLKGNKKLILGNHDTYPIAKYAEHFSKIYGAYELAGCILTHIPVALRQSARFKANIHGHMHKNSMMYSFYINVSAEQNNLTPILLEEVLARIPK